MTGKKVRIGIDVGGTFTHAVALAADKYELISQAKVPTTHTAQEGVALGIIQSLQQIMTEAGIGPDDITYIAHSTTQATNALLEGDVCVVGICAIGSGLEGKVARADTCLEPIELAPGIFLKTIHKYIDIPGNTLISDYVIVDAIKELQSQGAQAIVAATAFSVDDPAMELRIAELAVGLGMPATATHEISQLYGLKARTRTAAINAAIMPKMIETGERTKQAVLAMKIAAPLVVMRSDGGAMAIDEMKKRPILTLLSGPAAGVAAALMAARIADGIFLEVGGTSTDISCIVNGHPSVKMARIGDHKLYLNTIDVRTLGIAGGSLARFKDGKLISVGPRSAHIAGLKYSAFATDEEFSGDSVVKYITHPGETADYLAIEGATGIWTATTTCAANLLKCIPLGDYAYGNQSAIHKVMEKMATFLGLKSADELAGMIMEKGSTSIINTVNELISENKVDRARLTLIGGGGGASVWVNYIAEKMGLPASVVDHAPVISAIGAAMALLQETIERTIIDPKPQDFIDIREKAESALLRSGADLATVEVRVEVDTQRGILRATATGSHQMSVAEDNQSIDELYAKAATLLKTEVAQLTLPAKTTGFLVFQAELVSKKFFGLLTRRTSPWAVLDQRGRVRISASGGRIQTAKADDLIGSVKSVVEAHSIYGDAGLILPAVFVITENKIVDLSGLTTMEQIGSICQEEQARMAEGSHVVIAVKG